MALRKIGALWKKSDKHGKDYLAGQLDLGVLGKVQIAVFQTTEKQNDLQVFFFNIVNNNA